MKTKIFYGNQYVGKFNCNGDVSLKTKTMTFIKKWTKRLAWSMVFVWCLVGMFKLGQHLYPVTVYGEIKVPVATKFEEIPILVKICNAESGGRQFTKTGTVVRGNQVKSDIGFCQINETIWNDKARQLGYDIFTEQGNKDMAMWIFYNQGTSPWNSSKAGWSN